MAGFLHIPAGGMDDECAFCGRGDQLGCTIVCEDCQTRHTVCRDCAEEVATGGESELYRLVA
jgi:hypothetical protein